MVIVGYLPDEQEVKALKKKAAKETKAARAHAARVKRSR